MYTIYYGEKALLISSPDEATAIEKSAPRIPYSNTAIGLAISTLVKNETQSCVVVATDEDEALNALKKHYTVIQAGGGMVYTPEGFVLLIFRRGKWDLPKGKLDKGEDITACAIREVEEETGLTAPILKEKILTTYHTYSEKGKEILKESHWYSMCVPAKQDLQPQTEEDIEECRWVVAATDVEGYKENMHPSVRDVLNLGLTHIKV